MDVPVSIYYCCSLGWHYAMKYYLFPPVCIINLQSTYAPPSHCDFCQRTKSITLVIRHPQNPLISHVPGTLMVDITGAWWARDVENCKMEGATCIEIPLKHLIGLFQAVS